MTPQKPLNWVIDRLENGCAVLKNNGDEWHIPRVQLPEKVKEGDVLTAEFYLVKDEKARKENLARALLEEILAEE
jgi:hypothetical protein